MRPRDYRPFQFNKKHCDGLRLKRNYSKRIGWQNYCGKNRIIQTNYLGDHASFMVDYTTKKLMKLVFECLTTCFLPFKILSLCKRIKKNFESISIISCKSIKFL